MCAIYLYYMFFQSFLTQDINTVGFCPFFFFFFKREFQEVGWVIFYFSNL